MTRKIFPVSHTQVAFTPINVIVASLNKFCRLHRAITPVFMPPKFVSILKASNIAFCVSARIPLIKIGPGLRVVTGTVDWVADEVVVLDLMVVLGVLVIGIVAADVTDGTVVDT